MKKRYDRLLSWILFGAFALITLVLGVIFVNISSDSVYKDTIAPSLLGGAINVIQIVAYFFAYSVIFYCACKFTVRRTVNQIIIFLCALAFYYVSNCIVVCIDGNSFDPFVILYIAVLPLLLEIVLHGLILGVGLYIINKNSNKECLPIKKLISFSNPLQRAIGWGALVLSASRIIERIAYDIDLGAPKGGKEIFEMFVYYTSDILLFAVAYFVMTYFIINFYSRDKKEKADA